MVKAWEISVISKRFMENGLGNITNNTELCQRIWTSFSRKGDPKSLWEGLPSLFWNSNLKRRRQWQPTPVLLPGKSHGWRSLVGCSPWDRWGSDTTERLHFHFHFHALEKEMATHSSVLAWRIPGTGEPGGLLSIGSYRVRHHWSDLAAAAATK